jgi:KDO2-lipid IV(A) lauroyltransferase
MRTRWGTKLIKTRDAHRKIGRLKNTGSAVAFLADQTAKPDNAYWTTFLNQETPVFWGTEKFARKYNYRVVYLSIKRIKRGYYKLFAEILFDNPSNTNECEISEAHTRRLEKDIIKHPEIWLWTHRKWKHRKKSIT